MAHAASEMDGQEGEGVTDGIHLLAEKSRARARPSTQRAHCDRAMPTRRNGVMCTVGVMPLGWPRIAYVGDTGMTV